MRKSRFAGIVLMLAILPFVTPTARSAPPSAEAFGRIPQVDEVEISPNGKLVAWGDSTGETQTVQVFDLEQQKIVRVIAVDAGLKLREIYWADDETVLFVVSLTTDYGSYRGRRQVFEVSRTLAADVAGGPARILLMAGDQERGLVSGSNLLALRTPKPKTVIMWTWDFALSKYREEIGTRISGQRKDQGWVASVFEVDTRTGEGKLIMQGSAFTADWLVDGSGRPIVRSDYDPKLDSYRVLANFDGNWREIYHQANQGYLTIHGMTNDGTAVIAGGSLGASRNKLFTMPLDGSGPRILLADEQRDVEATVMDPYTWNPVGALFGGARTEIRWLDSKVEAQHAALARAFPGHSVRILSRSENGKRVVARLLDISSPSKYYLIDFESKTAEIIGEEYPALADVPLGEVRILSYKARDGLEIPAYLTIPAGAEPKKLPLVVVPHGGPERRDDPVFDWLAQFLASRGYAVLQPQFRGSTGFGEAFRMAGYRQWGGAMQDDITDGVKAMIAEGFADPSRVCIVGASYGGYAALAGATFTPDLYKCAASINGVSDVPALFGYVADHSGKDSNRYEYLLDTVGSPSDPKLGERSPARAANNVRAPILLLHGADDTVVPISQAEKMAKALEKSGKRYHLVKLPGEDHWLSRSDTRIRVLKELETFLAANL
jgi:dipeptidyl aminopeptidase/acylaminoacyl peptidase